MRVAWRADAHDRARHNIVERHLRRFRAPVQPAVRALAQHPALADLAVSFPALCVALALPRKGFDPAFAAGRVLAGAPLAAAAKGAGVPLWTRRLTPESFTGPVPVLPASAQFAHRIANHLPRAARHADLWLEAVAHAAHWADEAFALWTAREFVRDASRIKSIDRMRLRLIALWAWHSQHPECEARRFMERRWNPAMRMAAAGAAATTWWAAIDLHINLGRGRIEDMWLKPGSADGYEFRPLPTAADLIDEARAMNNCLRSYGFDVSHDFARLWSVRREGRRLATLRLGCARHKPLVDGLEIKLARNEAAPKDLWWAAQKWLAAHDLAGIEIVRRKWGTAPLDQALWRSLWRPYWLARREIPSWLPLRASRAALESL
ncbi:MAG: hypothetical protein KGJ78_05670 [Alphaproteobacteria bacterium]|nr:hypothetical protein [Alphaproteobacteria bacterium]